MKITHKMVQSVHKVPGQNLEKKYLQVWHTWNKTTLTKYCLNQWISKLPSSSVDFKAPQELWNPLRKAVPAKFDGSGMHSKNCLHDWSNSHRSWAWQIVLLKMYVIGYVSFSICFDISTWKLVYTFNMLNSCFTKIGCLWTTPHFQSKQR